jgi:cobalt-precorrin 5A hydrolase/precorrin-3B C17-methyltransferase
VAEPRRRVSVIGLGPAGEPWRTPAASARLLEVTDVVGYQRYVDVVPERAGLTRHTSGNRVEAERARFAFDLAASGRDVAVVSGGDPGVFAMAAAVVEERHLRPDPRWAEVELEVIPGVTAAHAAAARVGAPLGHDFCTISLSDVLKPWEVVERRLDAAAGADFVLALYNPRSNHRPWQLARALEIVGEHRTPETPVVVGRAVGADDERVVVTTLGELDPEQVDMRTVLIVGSSATQAYEDAEGNTWVVSPRTYDA